MPLTLGVLWAILCADVVQSLEYQVRPYAVVPGETDRVAREVVEHLAAPFRDRRRRDGKSSVLAWHLGTGHFVAALRDVHHRFGLIAVDRLHVKPTVKITGGFCLQTVEGEPNHDIHRWLEIKGDAEVHALWRCQMILTEAKKRAQREYDEALAKAGLTTERARKLLDANPAMNQADWRLPHHGAAGTAVNTVLRLAKVAAA